LLPVLLSPSSSSSASGCGSARGFFCASQRSADDDDLWPLGCLQTRHVFVLLLIAEDDDADVDAGLAGFLCASHLSSESARLLLAGLVLPDEEVSVTIFLLLPKECWPPEEEEEDDDDAGLPAGLVLCASHLPAASARLGLRGGELGRMTAHGGAGSSGSIVRLGGVGSSPGRAACAMARCTRATGIAMDRGRREPHPARSARRVEAEELAEVERSGLRS